LLAKSGTQALYRVPVTLTSARQPEPAPARQRDCRRSTPVSGISLRAHPDIELNVSIRNG
jgi:hypothetical protein